MAALSHGCKLRILERYFEVKSMRSSTDGSLCLYLPHSRYNWMFTLAHTGKKCIFQYGKSLENSMFEYPTLDNHWEIYSVPIKVQLFSNTGKMLFIHDLAAGVSLEVYWRTTHLVFQCWTMM